MFRMKILMFKLIIIKYFMCGLWVFYLVKINGNLSVNFFFFKIKSLKIEDIEFY